LKLRKLSHTYRAAGVDLRSADEFVRRLRRSARATFRSEVLSEIGAFGGFFDARFRGFKHPVLVSSIDGVGTKLKVAAKVGRHDTVGEDLVNHCVNDILVCGAQPLFFLDYLGIGRLSPSIAAEILDGIIRACRKNACALIGGETAEMPGLYRRGEYDLVGTIVGVAERNELLDGSRVREGDQLVALPSSGLHTNGYTLARRVLFPKYRVDDSVDELGTTIGTALLTIHRSYLGAITLLRRSVSIHAMAHITGGGIHGNAMRVVPARLTIRIDWNCWKRPPIFQLIQRVGRISESEMRRVFNLGVGIVFILARKDVRRAFECLQKAGEKPFVIGEIVRAAGSERG
jgi:phosphoribosylformylglycinamidine cyclo-ligase